MSLLYQGSPKPCNMKGTSSTIAIHLPWFVLGTSHDPCLQFAALWILQNPGLQGLHYWGLWLIDHVQPHVWSGSVNKKGEELVSANHPHLSQRSAHLLAVELGKMVIQAAHECSSQYAQTRLNLCFKFNQCLVHTNHLTVLFNCLLGGGKIDQTMGLFSTPQNNLQMAAVLFFLRRLQGRGAFEASHDVLDIGGLQGREQGLWQLLGGSSQDEVSDS